MEVTCGFRKALKENKLNRFERIGSIARGAL